MGDYWSPTIAALGKLIEKPSLTEERLTKLPFRFIRDVVASLIKTTGFPGGLYTDEELDVENLKEKPARVAWVKKIIDATSYTLGETINANPAKVVGSSDPEQTNEWLQALARAATAPKGDQEKGVAKALAKAESKSEKKKEGDGEKEKSKKERGEEKAKEGKEKEKRKERDKDGEGKEKEKPREKEGKEKSAREGKERKEKKEKEKEEPPPEPVDIHAQMAAKLRPSTSRAGPPVKKDAVERVDATAESVSAQSHAQGVIKSGTAPADDDDDDDEREIDVAAQHIREDAAALGAGKERDPAALGAAEIEAARAKIQVVREGEDDGLILTGTRKAKPRSTFDDEVHKMRQALQSLVNSTQPLGKAMDYIQEDIDSMARELNLLRNETTQQNVLFLEQQKATDDATAPLYNKLKDLETDISEQHQRTVLLKANIVANDETVKVLLRMVVMPDME